MKRALLLVGLTFFACPGVLTTPGNDFPCDFSKPIGERDGVCSAGDVCGVNNRCQRFQYEGPQFEGLPTFPDFSEKVDAGASLHPRVTGKVDFVAKVQGSDAVVLHTSQGAFQASRAGVEPVPFTSAPQDLDDLVLQARATPAPKVTGIQQTTNEVYAEGNPGNRILEPGMPPTTLKARRLRVVDPEMQRIGLVADPNTRAGLLREQPGRDEFVPFIPPAGAAVTVYDLAPGPVFTAPPPVGRFRTVVALASDGLRVRGVDGGNELVFPLAIPEGAVLAADATASTFAMFSVRAVGVAPTLSVFSVSRTGSDLQVTTPWGDCTPCTTPLAFTPGTDLGGAFVEVLCGGEGIKRVRGTLSSGPLAGCLTEPVAAPFDTTKVATTMKRGTTGQRYLAAEQDFSSAIGFLVGGENGQVWGGKTMSGATPVFLDRVPLDVASLGLRGTDELFALTQPGVFVHDADAGFVTVAPDVTSHIVALVNQGQGWVVGEQGNLVLIENLKKANLTTKFGPRLVDGRGQPVSSALRGEAITDLDGGIVSMVIAADDSLFFVPAPEPTNQPGRTELSAQLTPEPSTLIRSLALERSPVGTNGVDRVRGYLVTSRNVYEFKLGGAPLRWAATPLQLSGAEPVEVWFDNPRGGLGRVGYRDGTIFSTPGGFQLSEALPLVDGGVPAAVLDYENLGGWPVAYTSVGIFVARYDKLETGRLDSRFADGGVNKPMTWREVTLPDGSKPWLRKGPRAEALPGRLHVIAEPQTGTDRAYRRRFRLLVFLPDGVLELGQHERTNISTIVE
ncbi:MAG: hypothetical protein GQE15_23350 [Archangiaceae bacterium]|nr:hypothetical protein [Archangiaceae bacterium]